jgi:hypothetical protein
VTAASLPWDEMDELEPSERIGGTEQHEALADFADWIVSLDDVGAQERQSITLTKIIERARQALRGNKMTGS